MFRPIAPDANAIPRITADNVIFAVVRANEKLYGQERIPRDLASCISHSLGLSRTAHLVDERHLRKHMVQSPHAFFVGINLASDTVAEFRACRNLLTIGISSDTSYGSIYYCDIQLIPAFFPVSLPPMENKVVIEYNCLPSRMQPPEHKNTDYSNGKTIALYYRDPEYPGVVRDIKRETKILSEKYNYRFTAFTSRFTPTERENELAEHFSQLPNSTFLGFKSSQASMPENALENAFGATHAVWLAAPSLSTMSDVASMGMPLFVQIDPQMKKEIHLYPLEPDFMLLKILCDTNRLLPYSRTAIRSRWQPSYIDEWGAIGARIGGIIRNRVQEVARLSRA